MTKLDIRFNAEDDSTARFPVYSKYAGQCQAQPAYIMLDCRDGELSADYSGNIGGGCSSDEWHKLVLTFGIPSESHKSDL